MNAKKINLASGPATIGRRLHLLVRLTILALLALFATTPALAADGSGFASLYRYGKAADLGSQKQVTLFLRLLNYSGADVTDAAVVMDDLLSVGEGAGNIAGISINDGAVVSVSGEFAIPNDEYERWQAGASSKLVIKYIDDAGNQMRQPIELIPGLTGEQP